MVKVLLHYSPSVPWVTRISSRSALWPPHDGVRRARRLNLFHDLAEFWPAGSGLLTRSPCPSFRGRSGHGPVGRKLCFCSFGARRGLGPQRGRPISEVELGRVSPYAVQADRELAGYRHAGPRHAAAFGDIHGPRRASSTILRMRCLVEGGAGEFVAAAANLALDLGLAGLVARRRQSQMRPHRPRGAEPLRPVDGGAEGERRDRPDARCAHQPPTDFLLGARCREPFWSGGRTPSA